MVIAMELHMPAAALEFGLPKDSGALMRLLLPAAALLLAAASHAGEIHDDFEGGSNPDLWSLSDAPGVIVVDGGNPGAWLSSEERFGYGIDFRSVPQKGSPLAKALSDGLTSFAFDFQRQPTTCEQPGAYQRLMLILTVTHGTPDDYDDDDFAYAFGDQVTDDIGVWMHESFEIPSDSPDLPPGWTGGYIEDPEHFRPGVTWADFIRQVDEVDVDTLSPFEFHVQGCYNAGIDSIVIGYADNAIFANGFE